MEARGSAHGHGKEKGAAKGIWLGGWCKKRKEENRRGE